MAAQAFVQNGARVFIASRKESELRKVCLGISFSKEGDKGELGEIVRISISLRSIVL